MRLAALAAFAALSLGLAACAAQSSKDPQPSSTPDGGLLPFMSSCTLGQDQECETGLCFDFNSKGPHCTHACTMASDCEAPSPGCNGMGVCKVPGGGTGGGTGSGSGGG